MLTLVLDIYALYSDLPAYDLMIGGNMLKRKQTIINSTTHIEVVGYLLFINFTGRKLNMQHYKICQDTSLVWDHLEKKQVNITLILNTVQEYNVKVSK